MKQTGGTNSKGRSTTRHTAPCRRWLGYGAPALAWVALIVAVIHPPHGTGIPICWMQSLFDLPCAGCGLTRSVSCAVRGMWFQSWAYNPFGIPILIFFIFLAFTTLWPRRRRLQLVRVMATHGRMTNSIYFTLVGIFLIFGIARATGLVSNATDHHAHNDSETSGAMIDGASMTILTPAPTDSATEQSER